MKKKCIVLFSGGLDSRLAVKIMQGKGFEVFALFFKLPFIHGDEKKSLNFLRKQKIKFKVFDCTKGKLLQEFLRIVKKAQHGTGTGINPCIDCRIFMLKKAKKFADAKGIEMIATGEVLGQRPMSQHKKGLKIVEEESGLNGRLFRPLIDLGIEGRRRDKQIALAKKFKIDYPSPAGGCLLCEKELKERLKFLLNRRVNEKEIKLVGVGRHFLIDTQGGHTKEVREPFQGKNLQAGGNWIVLGKNKDENKIIEKSKVGKIIVPKFKGPSAVILATATSTKPRSPTPKKVIKKVNELIKAYSKQGSLEDRKSFERFKL